MYSSGARVPESVAAASYELAVQSANRALAIEAASRIADGTTEADSVFTLEETQTKFHKV
jgi:hypothetical protein